MECCQMLGDGQGPERVGVCLGLRRVWADALLRYLEVLLTKYNQVVSERFFLQIYRIGMSTLETKLFHFSQKC